MEEVSGTSRNHSDESSSVFASTEADSALYSTANRHSSELISQSACDCIFEECIYQATNPLPSVGGGREFDVCVLRAKSVRGNWLHFQPPSVDETSPLLPANIKQGFSDDGHTFPKRVRHSVGAGGDRFGVTGTSRVEAPSIIAERSLHDSNHDMPSCAVAREKKSNQRRTCIILSTTAIVLILLVSAGTLFYFMSFCPAIKPDRNRNQECTFQNFMMSTCGFTCKTGFVLKGSSQSTCDFYRRWSSPHPTCVCPSCYAGPQCQYSRDWNVLETQLKTMSVLIATLKIHYGNHSVSCRLGADFPSFLYKCTCEYVPTDTVKRCHHLVSPSGACINSLAYLIHDLVVAGVFPPPCHFPRFNDSNPCHQGF